MTHNTLDITTRAKLHEVYLTKDECELYYEGDVSVFDGHATPEWKRGDVLAVKGKWGYRNEWKAMWDGERAIRLGDEYADYGHVAEEFLVGREFHGLYWENAIDYNYVVYANFKGYENLEIIIYDGMFGKIVTLNGERWLIMSTEEPFEEKYLSQTELYFYPNEMHSKFDSEPLVKRYDIPLARILWAIEVDE